MGWSDDLNKIIKRDEASAERWLRAAVIQAANVAIIRTPVGNASLWKLPPPPGYVGGQLRANWRVSFGVVDFTIKDTVNFSTTAQDAANEILSFKLGQTIVVSNPMPYAPRIEYDGWSSQAPDGMARQAVVALKKALNKEANK